MDKIYTKLESGMISKVIGEIQSQVIDEMCNCTAEETNAYLKVLKILNSKEVEIISKTDWSKMK